MIFCHFAKLQLLGTFEVEVLFVIILGRLTSAD